MLRMTGSKTDDLLSTGESIGFLVRSLHQSFNKALARNIAHANLTTAQWYFLRALWEKNGVAQRELSNSIGLTESTTVAALKIMEKNGLVQRKRDPDDSRKIIVTLTRKGQKLQHHLLPVAQRINQVAYEGMDARQISNLKENLRKLRKRLEQEVSQNF